LLLARPRAFGAAGDAGRTESSPAFTHPVVAGVTSQYAHNALNQIVSVTETGAAAQTLSLGRGALLRLR
jgi:hypothetical protein